MNIYRTQPTLFNTPFSAPAQSLFGDIFDTFFDDSCCATQENQQKASTFMPKANIVEHDREYIVELDTPAVAKESFDISFKNKVLTVQGERKHEEKKDNKNFKRFEFSYGKFQRSFTFEHVNKDGLSAEYKDGILKITLPKEEDVLKKQEETKISIT